MFPEACIQSIPDMHFFSRPFFFFPSYKHILFYHYRKIDFYIRPPENPKYAFHALTTGKRYHSKIHSHFRNSLLGHVNISWLCLNHFHILKLSMNWVQVSTHCPSLFQAQSADRNQWLLPALSLLCDISTLWARLSNIILHAKIPPQI